MQDMKAYKEWRYSCILEIALRGVVNEQEPGWTPVLVCTVHRVKSLCPAGNGIMILAFLPKSL
jgi:hypothetical protein